MTGTSTPRTARFAEGFERPPTGGSTGQPRTSNLRFADEVTVEDLELMAQTAPPVLENYSNDVLFASADPLEKKAARMERYFRTDVDTWLTENEPCSPLRYEQIANTLTDQYMGKLDGLEGTPAVKAVRKRVISSIEALAVGEL